MKLTIISHTGHYLDKSGQPVGWGPTIREINFLATKFDKIYHCAPLHPGEPLSSSLPYDQKNIHLVPLKPSGGRNLKGKLSVIFTAWHNLRVVAKTLRDTDAYQFRAPTGMGVYMIPYLLWFVKKKGWFKYAGNWVQEDPPLGYAVQRYFLRRQRKHKVTINGKWENQSDNCLTFENPCLSQQEVEVGKKLKMSKDYNGQLNFCFVGRLESAKGVVRILKAFEMIGANSRVGTIHFVGDGPEKPAFVEMAKKLPFSIVFHGFLERNKVAEIFKESHVFLLPSEASEGFPKVIAEAMNYGCIPVVSDVSSIGQYVIDRVNGYLVDHKNKGGEQFKEKIVALLNSGDVSYLTKGSDLIAEKFTFDHYCNRIRKEILDDRI